MPTVRPASLVEAYLERIGQPRPAGPTLDALKRLHAAHVATIPFENLDILLGRGIALDLDRLRGKLVEGRRGGYCFEQNTLFQAVLRELGFIVTAHEARVRLNAASLRPRTHMLLVVEIDGHPWLADVGFGGDGLLEPVPLGATAGDAPGYEEYRAVREGALHVLQRRSPAGWLDLYAFGPEPVEPVDIELANWFTSTHPESHFVRTLTAQRTTAEIRYVLRYPIYSEIRGFDARTREITRAGLVPLLRDVFLIDLPLDVRFDLLDGPAGRAG